MTKIQCIQEHHEHVHTYQHHKKIASHSKVAPNHQCSACQVGFKHIIEYGNHISTKDHEKKLKEKLVKMKGLEEKRKRREENERNTKAAQEKRRLRQQQQYSHNGRGRGRGKRGAFNRFGYSSHTEQQWRNDNHYPPHQSFNFPHHQNSPSFANFAEDNMSAPSTFNSSYQQHSGHHFAESAQNWNRPLGYQFPYGQPQYHPGQQQGLDQGQQRQQIPPLMDRSVPPPAITVNYNHSHNIAGYIGLDDNAREYPASSVERSNDPTPFWQDVPPADSSSFSVGRESDRGDRDPGVQRTHSASAPSTARSSPTPLSNQSPNSKDSQKQKRNTRIVFEDTPEKETQPDMAAIPKNPTQKVTPTKTGKSMRRSSSVDSFSTKKTSKTPGKKSPASSAKSSKKKSGKSSSPTPPTNSAIDSSSKASTTAAAAVTETSVAAVEVKTEAVEDVLANTSEVLTTTDETTQGPTKGKKKLPSAVKRSSLKTLVSGNLPSSRALKYQLAEAVKQQKKSRGRNLALDVALDEGVSATPALEDSSVELVGDCDRAEVEALLSDPNVLQHLTTMDSIADTDCRSSKVTAAGPPSSSTSKASISDHRFAATMDYTRGTINPSSYVKSVMSDDIVGGNHQADMPASSLHTGPDVPLPGLGVVTAQYEACEDPLISVNITKKGKTKKRKSSDPTPLTQKKTKKKLKAAATKAAKASKSKAGVTKTVTKSSLKTSTTTCDEPAGSVSLRKEKKTPKVKKSNSSVEDQVPSSTSSTSVQTGGKHMPVPSVRLTRLEDQHVTVVADIHPPLHQNQDSADTAPQPQAEVIQTLLQISMREEDIRKRLPNCRHELEILLQQRDELDRQIASLTTQVSDLSQEELDLRTKRLLILQSASTSTKPVSHSDVTSSCDLTTPLSTSQNTKYIGGFITSDADEEKQVFSVLRERVRNISQSSGADDIRPPPPADDVVSRHSSTPSVSGSAFNQSAVTCFSAISDMREKMDRIVAQQAKRKESLVSDDTMIYQGHQEAVHHLVVKGDFLYSSSSDKTIKKFHLRTGACLNTYMGHESRVKSFIVLRRPNDKVFLCSGGEDHQLMLTDTDSGQILDQHNLDNSIMVVINSPWGDIYCGMLNGDIASYNIDDRAISERYTADVTAAGVMSLCPAQEGARKLLIVGGYDKIISIRDAKSGLLMRTLPLLPHPPRALAIDESRPYLYVGMKDTMSVYDFEKGILVKKLSCGKAVRDMVLVKHDGEPTLYTASEDGMLHQYNAQMIALYNLYQFSETLLAITYKKGRLYVGDSTGVVKSFSVERSRILCKINNCGLVFALKDQLLNHCFTSHLTAIVSSNRCPWKHCGDTEHHKTTEALRAHLYTAHLSI